MKRRNFLRTGALTAIGGALSLNNHACTRAKHADHSLEMTNYPELDQHKIDKYELMEVNFHWPRFVGKNGRIDFHGQHHKSTVIRLYTDQGATGWGLSGNRAKGLFHFMKNKKVSDLIHPKYGIIDISLDQTVEFALFDLCGNILNQPVYKLIGNSGNKELPVYSGMIYLDELNPDNISKSLDIILENCEWDYNYGYRQFKAKIGRSGRWYPHAEGLKKDIEVMQLMHQAFKDRDTELLVDANDMYDLKDTMQFLEGIGDIPLFWVEEPFRETLNEGRELRQWMDNNGFEKTLYADGELNPDFDVCLTLGKEKALNVFLPDTYDYGFTRWINLMPYLKNMGMTSSPHAWGDRLKTHYTAHLAAGLGNVVTVEGVTCLSDDIDYGNYSIIDGKIHVPDSPGFGMKLLKL